MMGQQTRSESLFYYFRMKTIFLKITCYGLSIDTLTLLLGARP